MKAHGFVLGGFLIATAVTGTARAQLPAASATRLTFDVASIKENTSPNGGGSAGFRPGGTFISTNVPLAAFLRLAFRADPPLTAQQVVGVPAWAEAARYDVTAKVPAGAAADMKELYAHQPEYVRSLLEDRFAFSGHLEKREVPVYALTIAPGGPKMKESPIDCSKPENAQSCGIPVVPGRLTAHAVQMSSLVPALIRATGRPVIDRTGLTGRFDVDLQWNPGTSTDGGDDRSSIFTAVQDELGLKLESTRAVLDVLVVEHLERPKEN